MRRFFKVSLILINILTAVFFIVGCYSASFGHSFWLAGLFNLASLYLLLLLVIFIIFWLFVKARLALIGVVSIALCWIPLRQLIKLKTGSGFAMQKNKSNLRVMSWNIAHFDILEHKTHPEVKQQMFDLINKYDPDIACFQEMVGSDRYPDAINYVPDIMRSIRMPYQYYCYDPKWSFDSKHEFGVIIFSKYPFVSQHKIAYEPNNYNDIFQYVDVAVNKDTFRVFNLHLQSLKFSAQNLDYINKSAIDEGKSFKQSMSILKKFRKGFELRSLQSDRVKKAVNESPLPVIVCGDFNDVPNSYAYATIGKGLKNAFAEKGSGIGRTFSGISPTLRIDNIFTDKRFTIEQFTCVQKKLSDHFPIITDIFYNGSGL